MRANLLTASAALLALMIGSHALSADSSPLGLWQAVDDASKQPTGWFLITEHDGVYDGILAKMFLQPGQDPNVVCDQCKDDRHNHPWLGLEIIRGMKQDGDKYVDGTILDPRDGKVYRAQMHVTPDGQTLVVRGFIGFALLGQNQYWTRLPDSAYSMIDPSVNPNSAVNPKRPPSPSRSEIMSPENSARR